MIQRNDVTDRETCRSERQTNVLGRFLGIADGSKPEPNRESSPGRGRTITHEFQEEWT